MAIAHQSSFTSADPVSATGLISSAVYTTTSITDNDCTAANSGFYVVCIVYPKQEVNSGFLSATATRTSAGNTVSLTSLGRLAISNSSFPVPSAGGGTGTWAHYFYLVATDTGGGDFSVGTGATTSITLTGFTFAFTSQNIMFSEALYTGVQSMRNMVNTNDTTGDWSDTVTTDDPDSWVHALAVARPGNGTDLLAGTGTTRRANTGSGGSREFALFDSGGVSGGASYALNYDSGSTDTNGSVAAELVFALPVAAFPAGNVLFF